MKLDERTFEYLRGKTFSNSLEIPYSYFQPIPNRIQFLTELVRGKRVLHLGCLDHLPLIDDKIKRNQWLHKELTTAAALCLGVDIDKETRDYVKTKHGFDNIILGDFTKQKLTEITQQTWDFAILGELLEHIDNPVQYLSDVRNLYRDCLRKIIITVPNAWTQTTIRKASKSVEIINSDHRYWFTPYTLAKVITQAGMNLEEIYFANRVPLTKTELIKEKVLKTMGKAASYNFTYASSIVAVANL
jgi:2-polyprenyl-3-methyl-5-hydroxy-6-metoxy-1,4-benzoquinol methylase